MTVIEIRLFPGVMHLLAFDIIVVNKNVLVIIFLLYFKHIIVKTKEAMILVYRKTHI